MFITGMKYARANVKTMDPFVGIIAEQTNCINCICLKADNEKKIFSFQLLSPKRLFGPSVAGFITKAIENYIKDKKIAMVVNRQMTRLLREGNNKSFTQYIELSDNTHITIIFNTTIDTKITTITFTVSYK